MNPFSARPTSKGRLPRRNGERFRARRGQSGQTLVEYALIIAYLSILVLQGMAALGFQSAKSMVYTSASLNLALHGNDSPAAQKTAVANYVSNPAVWGNADPAQVPGAITDIENRLDYIIDHPGSSY